MSLATCSNSSSSAATSQSAIAAPNWLFIDFLPVAELLQGAPELLEAANVIVGRAVQPEVEGEEENHPTLVLAESTRDRHDHPAPARVRADLAETEAQKVAIERATLQGPLASAKSDTARLLDEQTSRNDQIIKKQEEQVHLTVLRLQLIEQLTHLRDEQARLATQLRHHIDEQRGEELIKIRKESERQVPDLQDLQIRYQSSTAMGERQHQLTRFTEQPNLASGYFHLLAMATQQAAPSRGNETTSRVTESSSWRHCAYMSKC